MIPSLYPCPLTLSDREINFIFSVEIAKNSMNDSFYQRDSPIFFMIFQSPLARRFAESCEKARAEDELSQLTNYARSNCNRNCEFFVC